VRVALDAAAGFRIDWDKVRAAITPRTRMMILNFPHNPTGVTLQPDDIAALEAIVARHRLLLLSDEVYEHVVFDGRPHLSLACSPQLAQRTLVVSSFGKTLHATGWKIGYCCAPAPLTAEFRKVHQFMVFAVNTPLQHALARYLEDPAPYRQLPAFYQAKRDAFVGGLAGTRLRTLPCAGTYFVLADYSSVSDESDAAFAERLVREHRVASIPISALCAEPGSQRLVRFCFAKGDATLQRALERLARV
jgi:methionine aminotransferase